MEDRQTSFAELIRQQQSYIEEHSKMLDKINAANERIRATIRRLQGAKL